MWREKRTSRVRTQGVPHLSGGSRFKYGRGKKISKVLKKYSKFASNAPICDTCCLGDLGSRRSTVIVFLSKQRQNQHPRMSTARVSRTEKHADYATLQLVNQTSNISLIASPRPGSLSFGVTTVHTLLLRGSPSIALYV